MQGISNEEFASRIYKELLQLNNKKKKNQPNLKMCKESE